MANFSNFYNREDNLFKACRFRLGVKGLCRDNGRQKWKQLYWVIWAIV